MKIKTLFNVNYFGNFLLEQHTKGNSTETGLPSMEDKNDIITKYSIFED